MIDFILSLPSWAFGISISVVLFWLVSIIFVIYHAITAKDVPENQDTQE